jgi:hypothetical protein
VSGHDFKVIADRRVLLGAISLSSVTSRLIHLISVFVAF